MATSPPPTYSRRVLSHARRRDIVVAVTTAGLLGLMGCRTTPASPPPPVAPPPLPPPASQRMPSAEAYRAILASDFLLEEGDVPGAMARVQEALLTDPESPYLYVRLGELRLQTGAIDAAAEAARSALKRDRDDVAALRLLALARVLQSDPEAAKSLLLRALNVAPGDRRASTQLAEIYLKENEVEKAEGVIEALMAREPNATDGFVTLAQLFAERGQLSDARRHIARALERDGRNTDALELAKALAQAQGDFSRALVLSRRLVRERGDSQSTRHMLLLALLLAGEGETASPLLTSWLVENDSDEMLLLIVDAMERSGGREAARQLLNERRATGASALVSAERGRIAFEEHDFVEAERLLCANQDDLEDDWRDFAVSLCLRAQAQNGHSTMAIARARGEIAKDTPSIRLLRAAAFLAEKQDHAELTREVLEAFSRLATARPDDTALLGAQTETLEKLESSAAARARLDTALRARPRDPERVLALARHLERQDDDVAAVSLVEGLWTRGEATQSQLNFVAFTLADAKLRPTEAVTLAFRALARAPINGYVLDTVGWALFRAGRLDDAELYLRRASRLSPKEAEVLVHLAEVLRAQTKRAEATEIARSALAWVVAGDRLRERIETLLIELAEESS